MKIMFYDVEASGLDTLGSYVQELAFAIYDTDTWRCIKAQSDLVAWGKQYPIEPEAQAVTGLSHELCEENGRQVQLVFADFLVNANMVDFLCGHNAISYDKPMMVSNINRAMAFNPEPGYDHPWKEIPHIDTLIDCPYPATQKQMALKYLALDHGYVLTGAHEAMNDVFACAHILRQYDLAKVIEISKTPLVTLYTKIPWENAEGRERVKNARFYWSPTKKIWEKKIREFYLSEIQLQLGTDIELGVGRD